MRFQHILICASALACAVASASAQTATKTTPSPSAKKTSTAAPSAAHRPATAAAGLATDDDKAVYSIGLSIYNSLSQFNLSPSDLELVKRAMSDAAAGKPAVDLQAWAPKIEPLMKARIAKVSSAYLAKCAAEPGVMKTPSGLIYKDVTKGTGPSPAPEDKVKVNYRGTFPNGKVFDASKEPIEFGLNQVIKCWTEGVSKMKVGGKAHLVCPSDIAYGDQGRPGIPGGSTLVFDVELLSIAGK
jgi:FKBP-type peptidyl-prolyl cis-trans isomerase FkpA